MYTSRDDQAMIPLTRFDFASFHFIVNLFAPKYNEYTPVVGWDGFILCKVSLTQGRPRLMNPADCLVLVLVLAWSRTQGSMMVIQFIFGLRMIPVAKYLQYAQRVFVKVLKANSLSKIPLPKHDKLEEYRSVIEARPPILNNAVSCHSLITKALPLWQA
jgi:hypothetical protein